MLTEFPQEKLQPCRDGGDRHEHSRLKRWMMWGIGRETHYGVRCVAAETAFVDGLTDLREIRQWGEMRIVLAVRDETKINERSTECSR